LKTANLTDIEKDWKKRGFSLGVWTDAPGQIWEDYVHDTDELFMVVEGKVELEMHGKKWCPESFEEIMIPARMHHSVRNVGGTTSRWLYGYKAPGRA